LQSINLHRDALSFGILSFFEAGAGTVVVSLTTGELMVDREHGGYLNEQDLDLDLRKRGKC
jgi:hypothetical protein